MKSYSMLPVVLCFLFSKYLDVSLSFIPAVTITRSKEIFRTAALASSPTFYNDFEDYGKDGNDNDDNGKEEEEEENVENDEEDDDDEYNEIDDMAVADFRSKLGNMFGDMASSTDEKEDAKDEAPSSSVDDLIRKATQQQREKGEEKDWAESVDEVEAGVVLIANPEKFCTDFGSGTPSAALLNKFGLTFPPPADLGPDRRADLLPVLCVLEKHPLRGSQALLLNRRTGYLLGDLEQQANEENDMPAPPPRLGAFMIQPLWFGGTSSGGSEDSTTGSGLDMLHQCPAVPGARQITPDGLYWGGDPAEAQDAMKNPDLERMFTGFDFKFFVQSTRWLPLQLEKEIRDGTWFVAKVSKEVLFKARDRMGTRRAKPLWTEIMELMGGEYKEIRNRLYVDDAPFP